MTNLAFIDTETTGLDRDVHEVWEIGLIIRNEPWDISRVPEPRDSTYLIQLNRDYIHLNIADPQALKVNMFYDRYKEIYPGHSRIEYHGTPYDKPTHEVIKELALALNQVHFVAAVPDFDAWFIKKLLNSWGFQATWHYHLVCVENLVAGYLGVQPPWKSADLYEMLDIDTSKYEKHTALGDAMLVRDVYDLIMTRLPHYPKNPNRISPGEGNYCTWCGVGPGIQHSLSCEYYMRVYNAYNKEQHQRTTS